MYYHQHADSRLMDIHFVQRWVNSLPTIPSQADDDDESLVTDTAAGTARPAAVPPTNNVYKQGTGAASVSGAEYKRELNLQANSNRNNIDLAAPTKKPLTATTSCPTRIHKGRAADTDRRRNRLAYLHSNYSSLTSDSSIDHLLDERRVDPEEVLMNLGFGCGDSTLADRLPTRFLVSQTKAHGIDMEDFLRVHPEFGGNYPNMECGLAMSELYHRLPSYYHSNNATATSEASKSTCTTLHKQFTMQSQEHANTSSQQTFMPVSVHKTEEGLMYASILTRANTEELAKQGFYSEHSSLSSRLESSSSLSTHDCTIESSDLPSPIVLNNDVSSSSSCGSGSTPTVPSSPEVKREAFINHKKSDTSLSLGSDSVFSSAGEEFKPNAYVLAKLESIQEKSLQELSDDDLEDGIGISFVSSRRYSTGDIFLTRQTSSSEDNSEGVDLSSLNAAEKRKGFTRTKRMSFNEETLAELLREQLGKNNNSSSKASRKALPDKLSRCNTAPIIVQTEYDVKEEDEEAADDTEGVGGSGGRGNGRVVPKQVEGLLQVVTIDSFDSIDSDTCTVVPSPNEGLSPNCSRAGSLGVIPALESFELEEIQSTDQPPAISSSVGDQLSVPTPKVNGKNRRPRLQRSISIRSQSDADSDSSGIADVDGKSQNDQTDSGDNLASLSPKLPRFELSPSDSYPIDHSADAELGADSDSLTDSSSHMLSASLSAHLPLSHRHSLSNTSQLSLSQDNLTSVGSVMSDAVTSSGGGDLSDCPSYPSTTIRNIRAPADTARSHMRQQQSTSSSNDSFYCTPLDSLTTLPSLIQQSDSFTQTDRQAVLSDSNRCRDVAVQTDQPTLCYNCCRPCDTKPFSWSPETPQGAGYYHSIDESTDSIRRPINFYIDSNTASYCDSPSRNEEAYESFSNLILSHIQPALQEFPEEEVLADLTALNNLTKKYKLGSSTTSDSDGTANARRIDPNSLHEQLTRLTEHARQYLPAQLTESVSPPIPAVAAATAEEVHNDYNAELNVNHNGSSCAMCQPIKSPESSSDALAEDSSGSTADKSPPLIRPDMLPPLASAVGSAPPCQGSSRPPLLGGVGSVCRASTDSYQASSEASDVPPSKSRDRLTPLTLRRLRGGAGSMTSSPMSTSSSVTGSSISRLSDQLSLSERKRAVEKQIADLEMQKYKLSLDLKDEEIRYWRSVADSPEFL